MLGVYGISALLLLGAGALVALVRGSARARLIAAALLLLPWADRRGAGLAQLDHPVGPPVSVAVLQGAVPQDLKWQESNVEPRAALYARSGAGARRAADRVAGGGAAALANEIPYYLGKLYSGARTRLGVVMGDPARRRGSRRPTTTRS